MTESRCKMPVQKLPPEGCLDCIRVHQVYDALEALSILEAIVLQEQVCGILPYDISHNHSQLAG